MGEQLSWLDGSRTWQSGKPLADQPRARRTDPGTSHVAAQRMSRGRADAHRQTILAAIRAHPWSTYRGLAELTGLEPVAVGRRLVELERAGLARPDGETLVDGRLMRTWVAA